MMHALYTHACPMRYIYFNTTTLQQNLMDQRKMKALLVTTRVLSCLLLAGCSRPLLVVPDTVATAEVTFRNNSTGYLQQFFFDDPITCTKPNSIDYTLNPYQVTTHKIPAEQVITIWTSGFGLPADPGKVAWCHPAAFSTKLVRGHRYLVSFEIDTKKKLCGTVLLTDTGTSVTRVERRVNGPEIGGGGMLAGSFSCDATDGLGGL